MARRFRRSGRSRRQRRGRAPGMTHHHLVELVNVLWAAQVHERRVVCVELFVLRLDLLAPADALVIERLLRESQTWALVDGLAASVMGGLVERYPELNSVLDRWAVDDDFWLRRSALLALLIPLRQSGGDFERFGRYADAMLDETRVLHPQGHRLGVALHRPQASRPRVRLAAPEGGAGVRRDDPRGAQAAVRDPDVPPSTLRARRSVLDSLWAEWPDQVRDSASLWLRCWTRGSVA